MIQERKFRIRSIASLIATMIVAGIVGWFLFRYAMPQYYFRWYPAIPLYFTLLSVAMAIAMNYWSKRKPDKIITVLMIVRGCKMILTLGSLLLYYWLIDEQMVQVALTTLVFYFLHLFVETYLFYRFEKLTKRIRE